MESFEIVFPVAARNIKKCEQLADDDKGIFFALIDGAGHATSRDMEEHAEDFFRANRMRGAVCAHRDGITRLGHLHQWSALLGDDGAMEVLRDAPFDIRDYQDAVKTEDWMMLEEMLDYLEDVPINYVVWGFLSNGKSPYNGIDLRTLPCRLGLEPVDPDAFFPIEIEVPADAQLNEATAFDAGFFVFWCPGGWTCPRPECPDADGFREVITLGANVPGGWVTFDHAAPPYF